MGKSYPDLAKQSPVSLLGTSTFFGGSHLPSEKPAASWAKDGREGKRTKQGESLDAT